MWIKSMRTFSVSGATVLKLWLESSLMSCSKELKEIPELTLRFLSSFFKSALEIKSGNIFRFLQNLVNSCKEILPCLEGAWSWNIFLSFCLLLMMSMSASLSTLLVGFILVNQFLCNLNLYLKCLNDYES